MPFLWEWVSYKTDHRENYLKVLVTFIVGLANLDSRSEFMLWFNRNYRKLVQLKLNV